MSNQEKFNQYDQNHPEVYQYLLKLCRNAQATGIKKYAISPLVEITRWHLNINRGLQEEFKIRNDFKPWYARKIAAENPEFEGFFEFRPMRAK